MLLKHNTVTLLKYSGTNTYLIRGRNGSLLFDTGWAGTFPLLCRMLGEKKLRLQDISYVLISHFHPDHMGIAQQIADAGAVIAVMDVQKDYIHSSDHIFEKERRSDFVPVDDKKVRIVPITESRSFLNELGISGEIFAARGHSDDSISLWLDKERALFVGDLAPLYELELHKGTETGASWERLLALRPKTVYYGHAAPASPDKAMLSEPAAQETDVYALVRQITRLADKGVSADVIKEKTGADEVFIRDVIRMYVTHPNVSVQGILDRIEIKGR